MQSDKKMFEWKKQPATMDAWDESCAKKSADFLTGRAEDNFELCFHELCDNMDIRLNKGSFVYFFDYDFNFLTSISNIVPDYSKILACGIRNLLYEEEECSNEFCTRYNAVVLDMLTLVDRIIAGLDKESAENTKKIQWFRNMKSQKADGFAEALQRVLFLNQLIWQTGGRLVGLGRLDMLLQPYYEKDIANGNITELQAKEILTEFLQILHGNYWYKSSVMLGDTGQVMILGGLDANGTYQANDMTYLLLDTVRECHMSDPKIVLRISGNMPRKLMEEAVKCMSTGIGSPLLSNDDVIIPKLLEFGIEREDAYAYTTSACWEPLIGGKSSSMNNQNGLVYIKALNALFMEEDLSVIDSFHSFKEKLWLYLRREVISCIRKLYEKKLYRNTLYSVFIEGCRKHKKDITDGGAVYHNIGMTTVGLGNLVNALLNIEQLVYEEGRFSLTDIKKIIYYNFEGYSSVEMILKDSQFRYGQDEEKVTALCNEIIRYISSLTLNFRTPVGGRLKFGISSPDYIMRSGDVKASFDGRRNGEPFIVHISNEKADSYTELINFAASLDYGENRFNGNVVDFMVSPSFMERNFDKFVSMLMSGIKVGFFQLQANVISSEILLKAKRDPESFPNLIVRVWGFSAYFTELPESYQDLLIERALENEGKSRQNVS